MNRQALTVLLKRWVIAVGVMGAQGCGDDDHCEKEDFVSVGGPYPGDVAPDGAIACAVVCSRHHNVAYDTAGCYFTENDGGAASLVCEIKYCGGGGGRRPAGLVVDRDAHSTAAGAAGRYFAQMAHLEDASIVAFNRLRKELVAFGAPARMAARANVSAHDEVRHTTMMTALARRFGAQPARVAVAPPVPRSLEAFAIENAVEGCVGETWGAVVAAWQSRFAEDRSVRRTMSLIAEDEAQHAQLAWDVAAWIDTRLDEEARTRVKSATANAAAELKAAVAIDPVAEQRAIGLPPARAALTLLHSMRTDLGI